MTFKNNTTKVKKGHRVKNLKKKGRSEKNNYEKQ